VIEFFLLFFRRKRKTVKAPVTRPVLFLRRARKSFREVCQNAICTPLRSIETSPSAAQTKLVVGHRAAVPYRKKIMMASKAWKVSTADPRWNASEPDRFYGVTTRGKRRSYSRGMRSLSQILTPSFRRWSSRTCR